MEVNLILQYPFEPIQRATSPLSNLGIVGLGRLFNYLTYV